MDLEHLRHILLEKGLLSEQGYRCQPLMGGVSSEIYLVGDHRKSLVVKKALHKLKVRDNWVADISRNRVEQDFIRYIGALLPDSVPEILYSDLENEFFVMEYFDDSYKNWKTELLKGKFNPRTTYDAAQLLSTIHASSYKDPDIAKTFDTSANFMNLRTAPYLLKTAERNPELQHLIKTEAQRLQAHRECLVHGDFSPKNILTGVNRLVLLDHEVAWFGDPAFDLAFMLTHLHLKQLVQGSGFMELPDLPRIFWDTYFEGYPYETDNLKKRSNHLWLMVLLARVDGKSPVEYLEGETGKQELIRSFVYEALNKGLTGRKELVSLWHDYLKNRM